MLREVALALMRFSPMVAVCEEDTVVVDVSASLRLFGGILRICHQIREVVDVSRRERAYERTPRPVRTPGCSPSEVVDACSRCVPSSASWTRFRIWSCRKSAGSRTGSPTGSRGSGAVCSKISVACRAPV